MKKISAFLFALALGASAAQAAPAANAQLETLKADIAEISKLGAGSAGKVGVVAWRLDGQGPQLFQNADEPFPMASTFKIAVAGAVFHKIDSGQSSLDKMITIDQDKMVMSEVIAQAFIHPGVSLSVYNLLELMLTHSDNTATDYMVAEAGGPAAVTAWVRSQGIQGLRVDGDTNAILRRFYGLSSEGPIAKAMAERRTAAPSSRNRGGGMPNAAFDNDPRDTTSVRQMAELLTKIANGKALSPSSTQTMIEIMKRCKSGLNRLRAMMPPETVMADKTGTIGGTVNDIGIVFLPNNDNVLIGVYIKASDATTEAREKTIAQIGRSVRDFYLYDGQGRK